MENKGKEFDPAKLPLFEYNKYFQPASQLNFFQFVVEQVGVGVFLIHRDSETVYVNPAACERLGFDNDELTGKYVYEWDPLFPQEAWPGYWKELIEHKHLHFKTMHTTKTGEVFPVDIHAHYYANDNEEFSLAFVTEITEQKT